MITGDNPLTACHVAREVEIVNREVLILDLRKDEASNDGKLHFGVIKNVSIYSYLMNILMLSIRYYLEIYR